MTKTGANRWIAVFALLLISPLVLAQSASGVQYIYPGESRVTVLTDGECATKVEFVIAGTVLALDPQQYSELCGLVLEELSVSSAAAWNMADPEGVVEYGWELRVPYECSNQENGLVCGAFIVSASTNGKISVLQEPSRSNERSGPRPKESDD